MDAVIIYIAKSASLVLVFYCAYYFLLRKETFFNSNRWFLLSGLLTSAVLPLLVYTKTVWIEASPNLNINLQPNFAEIHSESSEINWTYIILSLYALGLLICIIKFVLDFYSLNSIIKGKKIYQQADFKFVDIKENIAPFSYFEYIVYNSSLYTETELENIIEHEKVHSDQNHTVDVLISRVFSIIFWFNPIIWLYKKAITQNLEFIADSEAAKKLLDKKAYQYTLLKITTHENCVAITNHFYQSLIKKRIVMLNKNQSKKRNSWKYYTVIPVLATFVLLFQVKVVAREKQQIVQKVSGEIKSVDVYKIRKNSSDTDLKEIKEKLKTIHNVDFEASEIKRNSKNDLTSIKIVVKNGTQQTQSIQTGGNKIIKDFGIIVITDANGSKKVGIQTSEETTSLQSHAMPSGGVSTLTNESNNTTNQTSSSHQNAQVIISNKLNTKTENNVNTNSNNNTKTYSNTNTATTINSNTDTKVFTNKEGATIVFSNNGKENVKHKGFQLLIIDGDEMPADFNLDDLDQKKIKTMSVFKGNDAISKFGEEGKDGVIVIETKK